MVDFSRNYRSFNELDSKPKAIIFDWDNTLADTWPLIQEAMNEARTAFGKEPWSAKEVKDKVHKSMRESFPIMFGDDWQAAGKLYLESYARNNLVNLKLLPDALDLLKELKKQNIAVFLVSNKIGATLRKEVEALNLGEYFFSVVGSMDADADKPNIDSTALALRGSDVDFEKYQGDKKDIWFIGDTISDIRCAINCQFRPIVFNADYGEVSGSVLQDPVFAGEELPLYHDHKELLKKISAA